MAKKLQLTPEGWLLLISLLEAAGYASRGQENSDLIVRKKLKEDFFHILYPKAALFEDLDDEGKEGRSIALDSIAAKIQRLRPNHPRGAVGDTTLRILSRLSGLNDPQIHRNEITKPFFSEILDPETGRIDYLRFFRRLTIPGWKAGATYDQVVSDGGLILKDECQPSVGAPPVLDLQVLLASSRGKTPLAFHQVSEAVPVSGGQVLMVRATISRPAYLYAFWVRPDGEVQPIYPWVPGKWNLMAVSKELALSSLELPRKDAAGEFDSWKIGKTPGLETLVVAARSGCMSTHEGLGLREDFQKLKPVHRIKIFPGPHQYTFGGRTAGTRIEFHGGKIVDSVAQRHGEIEKRLAIWFETGACLSFLNAG
jgi:hypothetical protein